MKNATGLERRLIRLDVAAGDGLAAKLDESQSWKPRLRRQASHQTAKDRCHGMIHGHFTVNQPICQTLSALIAEVEGKNRMPISKRLKISQTDAA